MIDKNKPQDQETARMAAPFNTSSIPDDQAYWDSLAERVTSAAVKRPMASAWLTRGRAPWIAAASLAFAAGLIFGLLGLAAFRRAAAASNVDWSTVLAPRDAIGRSFASIESAPAIGEVLAASATETPR